ncbi:MAG: 4-hydroxythreonine-4-phosphate dehydrogenase PdxA [Phycisphaerales bacterium]
MSGPDSSRPTVAITMGDLAGIGPEVIVRALADPELRRRARFVVYGHNASLTVEADRLGMDPNWFRVGHDSDRTTRPMTEDVVVFDFPGYEQYVSVSRGPSKAAGHSSKTFVETAIADAMRPATDARHVDAIVTAPISKESWSMAGFKWPGHTELFAHRTRTKRSAMMFVSPRMRVILATTHIPLMKLRDDLTIGRVHEPIDLGHAACQELGIESPRIAVCGLNPHAGEQGMFGDEERRLISPAIDVAKQNGIDVHGPFPADTVFIRAAAGDWDLVVAMYHDQGLIPVKLLGWDKAVNWTVGLPIVRTSPDHGTAFDIAGRGKASEGSIVAAIELAVELAERRMASAAAN